MTTAPLTRSNHCPRCRIGFIIFEGSMDGDASCMNCGHHVPSNRSLEPDAFKFQQRVDMEAKEGVASVEPTPIRPSRRQVNRSGLDL